MLSAVSFSHTNLTVGVLGVQGLDSLNSNIELGAAWKSPAVRAAANNVVISAVRSVKKALRELGVGCHSAGQSRAAVDTGRGASSQRTPKDTDQLLPRLPPPPPPPPVKIQGLITRSESSEEDDIEADKIEGASAKSDTGRRPPEPDHPPPRGRALVCASKIFFVCASNIFLVCASLFAFYHIFHSIHWFDSFHGP